MNPLPPYSGTTFTVSWYPVGSTANLANYGLNLPGYALVRDSRRMTLPSGTGDVRYYEFGTWTRATARGATLAGPTVTSRRIAVLGTTCPTCGAVDVYVGTTRLGTLSMKGAMKHRALLMLPARATAVHGQIRLVVRTSGLPVIVDAIGTRIN